MLLLKLEGEESALPLAPPRNRSQLETDNDCENPLVSNSALQPASNGLPPTPKVHMGACFSKVSLHQHNQSSIVYLFENNNWLPPETNVSTKYYKKKLFPYLLQRS